MHRGARRRLALAVLVACACAAVSVTWRASVSVVSPSVLISDAEAAAVLQHVLREHDKAAAHHAGAVLEAVVDSIDMPGDRPLEEQYESERQHNEQRVSAAVLALDEEEEGTQQDTGAALEEVEGAAEEEEEPEMFSAKWLQEEEPDMQPETFPVTWYVK